MQLATLTLQDFLKSAQAKLSSIVDQPWLEAEVLIAFGLNESRSFLHAYPETVLTDEEVKMLTQCIERRLNQEPIAYITGQREFWSHNFYVNPHTLIPRPETELLVESVLKLIGKKKAHVKIADLGTGSGVIALTLKLECPHAEIFAVDVSQSALNVAKKNQERLGVSNVSFYEGHWCSPLPCRDFDIIVSNPPYLAEAEWHQYASNLAFEPRLALLSGGDGLNAIREISQMAQQYLKSGGYLLFEHGFRQGSAVRQILADEAFVSICSIKDLSGVERVTSGQRLF